MGEGQFANKTERKRIYCHQCMDSPWHTRCATKPGTPEALWTCRGSKHVHPRNDTMRNALANVDVSESKSPIQKRFEQIDATATMEIANVVDRPWTAEQLKEIQNIVATIRENERTRVLGEINGLIERGGNPGEVGTLCEELQGEFW